MVTSQFAETEASRRRASSVSFGGRTAFSASGEAVATDIAMAP